MNSQSGNRRTLSTPIVVVGMVVTIGVACVTGLAVNAAISKFNADADRAYAAAVEHMRTQQLSDWLTNHSSSGSNNTQLDYTPDTETKPMTPTDIIEIDGKFYINTDLIVNPDGTHAADCPCYYCRYDVDLDSTDKIVIDDKEYIYVTEPDDPTDNNNSFNSVDGDDSGATNLFDGIDYLSIDIDGNAIYLIEKGDTLSKISGKVGYSVEEIAEYNGIQNVDLIYEGSSLRIPVTEEFYEYISGRTGDASVEITEDADLFHETEVVIPETVEELVVDDMMS